MYKNKITTFQEALMQIREAQNVVSVKAIKLNSFHLSFCIVCSVKIKAK